MKATTTITNDLLMNKDEFTHEFFTQFKLRNDKQPLQLNETISKDYLFPTFYGDATCSIGVFLCDYKKAQAMLAHEKMKPVAMPKGRALVTFSCYEYKRVLGVNPYNEIAMTIPVMIAPKINPPILPIVMERCFKNFGYYVFHMPVTSLENQIRGQKIWGLPKVLDEIDIHIDNSVAKTTAIDESGNDYFSLSVPTEGKKTHFNVHSNLYSQFGNQLKQSTTQFSASFNVNKYIDRLWKTNKDDPQVLTIGQGPYGDMLRKLDIDPNPFQFRYSQKMNACFDLPNEDYKAPFSFT